jgi:predicted nucleotidyltransferase
LTPLSDQIRAAFLFGSLAGGQEHASSDVDLMIVGDVSFAAVVRALADSQRRLGRDVNPTVYRSAEFAAKLRSRHHFLTTVTNGPKLFLVGDEDELARLAEERLAPPARHQPNGAAGFTKRLVLPARPRSPSCGRSPQVFRSACCGG